jgi:hypothetical protein
MDTEASGEEPAGDKNAVLVQTGELLAQCDRGGDD